MPIFSLILMLFLAACDRPGASVIKTRAKTASPPIEEKNTPALAIAPLTDDEMMAYFQSSCASCHGKGDEKTPKGQFTSFWGFDPKSYDVEAAKLDPDAALVYQTIVNRMKSSKNGPSAMPPPDVSFDPKETERLFAWYKTKAPTIIKDVHVLFPEGAKIDANDVKIDLTFKCKSPATFRDYIRRVTNDAFSREPSPTELSLAGPDPDIKVEQKHRNLIKDRLADEWKSEFMEKGLKKFAYKVSGANQMNFTDTNTDEFYQLLKNGTEDLKDEFYQLLKNGYNDLKYKDMLLGPSLMVSAKTAPMYGCSTPNAGWKSCALSPPRKGYFTSVSFLASKPSSFLIENNNYGRMAVAHFMIHGQTLQAATNGPVGEAVHPIPSCLKSLDRRGIKNSDGSIAPRGAISIPESGNICQSCHLSRNLASGSILFRPFNPFGKIYNVFSFKDDSNYNAAIKDPWVIPEGDVSKPVDSELLEALLLGNNERACVISGTVQKPAASVNELMTEIIGDGSILAKGLAIHMARSLSNLSVISLETLESTKVAFEMSEGKLEKAFQSYFATETYSCKKEVE